jgi:hypothetical protein
MKFNPLLVHKGIPRREHYNFRKWLRCYLVFYNKYHFPESQPESLPHFIKKLQEKHQSSHQQQQAALALLHSFRKSSTMAWRLPKRTKAHAPTPAAWPQGRTLKKIGGPCLSAASWSALQRLTSVQSNKAGLGVIGFGHFCRNIKWLGRLDEPRQYR